MRRSEAKEGAMFDVLIESDPNLKPRKTALSLAISVVLFMA